MVKVNLKVVKGVAKAAVTVGYIGLAAVNILTSEEKVDEAMKIISKVTKVKRA